MIAPEMKTPPADGNSAVTDKYTEAFNLNARICISAQMAQQNLYEVCKGLKEMRDGKLYKELGYRNFEEYVETEVGFGRMQAHRLIAIAENLSKDFVTSMLQIGTTKLALLAKLDEPQREEIQQNTDLESVSVRELKNQIKELESARMETESELAESKRRNKNLVQKNIELVEQVKELESRPVEVAVSEPEIREVVKEVPDKEALAEKDRELSSLREELDKTKESYESRIAELQKSSERSGQADKNSFKALYADAYKAFNGVLEFIKLSENPDRELYIERTEKLLDAVTESLHRSEADNVK